MPGVLLLLAITTTCFVLPNAYADTLANCTYEELRGSWFFEVGPSNSADPLDCKEFKPEYSLKVHLAYPDVATDQFNNQGFWTIIYNQGFEVIVAGRKYFGFSAFKDKVTSYCNKVTPGWSHDVLGNDWACFRGKRSEPATVRKAVPQHGDRSLRFQHKMSSEEMVTFINNAQSSWTATHYSHLERLDEESLIKMAGGRKSRVVSPPRPARVTRDQELLRGSLPKSFDWRKVDGQNFVSPVRDQKRCGSCYAFGSLAMAEARVRIQTNNTQRPVFSTQDIIECSVYSQGCEGGYPYLIAGKYAEDFGLVEEKCNPYKGQDGKCTTAKSCQRHYTTNYRYVGGYFGGCNEVAMMEAIYNRGPVTVAFMVYPDFSNYQSGVYHHIFTDNGLQRFNPIEMVNHGVLIVGWGETKTDRYWIVKNSWGADWGMEGYFWIRRGTDECGIESMAVEATPIVRFD